MRGEDSCGIRSVGVSECVEFGSTCTCTHCGWANQRVSFSGLVNKVVLKRTVCQIWLQVRIRCVSLFVSRSGSSEKGCFVFARDDLVDGCMLRS